MCRRLTGNDTDAADATQDALISIVKALPRFDERAKLSTWAYRIAVNASLDELRRRRRRPAPTDLADLETRADWGTGPDDVAQRLDIDAALMNLPPEFRAPVVLRDLGGLDYAEIAEILDIPPGTVRSRISRGRSALADHMGGNSAPTAVRPSPEP